MKRIHVFTLVIQFLLRNVAAGRQQHAARRGSQWVLVLRNAKIFARLTRIAKPGDRILVTFGAGHCYWLRHLVRNTPGFVLVEANDYLR
ncbi:MAG TPA: DUF5694 domain-containing protein [Candidatus Udaeobacter sp.]|nr:DUF5694 domain-containing protein [Candidatus Udaeobacter sp.]